jgi:hypothetical protein
LQLLALLAFYFWHSKNLILEEQSQIEDALQQYFSNIGNHANNMQDVDNFKDNVRKRVAKLDENLVPTTDMFSLRFSRPTFIFRSGTFSMKIPHFNRRFLSTDSTLYHLLAFTIRFSKKSAQCTIIRMVLVMNSRIYFGELTTRRIGNYLNPLFS